LGRFPDYKLHASQKGNNARPQIFPPFLIPDIASFGSTGFVHITQSIEEFNEKNSIPFARSLL